MTSDRPIRLLVVDDSPTARGLIVAISTIGLGTVGFIWSLLTWASVNFGTLADPIILRVLILSLIGMAIGVQLGFTVFLAGIMSIPNRRDQILAALNQDLSKIAPSR